MSNLLYCLGLRGRVSFDPCRAARAEKIHGNYFSPLKHFIILSFVSNLFFYSCQKNEDYPIQIIFYGINSQQQKRLVRSFKNPSNKNKQNKESN